MDHYVIAGVDESRWRYWGESWIISLKELAKYDENILIIDLGLSSTIKNKIAEFGGYVLPGKKDGNQQANILRAVTDFSVKYPGIFAIWDIDVYFQNPIEEIFNLASKQITLTSHDGFYAGSNIDFIWLREMQEMISFVRGDVFVGDYLKKYFPNKFIEVDNSWNYTEIQELENQKVIHPLNEMKSLLTNKNVLFWERHKDLYNKHSVVNHITRKLV